MIPRPDYPWIVILTMLFAIPTTLLANCAPKRGGFGIRAAIALAGLFVVFGIVDTVNMAFPRPDIADLPTFVPSIIGFGTSIIALSAAAFICYDMSIWVAAFCGTAGYICQNMGNRLGSILGLLFPSAPGLLTGHHNGGFGFIGALIVYAAVCLLMVRPVRRYGLTGIDNRHMLLMTIVVIFVNIIAALTLGSVERMGFPLEGMLVLNVLHLTTSVLMLFLEYEMLYKRRMVREVEAIERVLEERARQYELSRENIDAINVKCHDIRHQIRHLQDSSDEVVDRDFLADIAREVDVYDSTVKTGNDALDTILTEKSLVCERESITLTCIADGKAVSFMAPADIYAFLGNALDNAIEAERAIDNRESRSIALVVREIAGMASIHVENYFIGETSFVDGLPKTTKDDAYNHGFGTKSMRLIAERYGGTLSMGTEENTFYVNALIPIPASSADS